jgi:predicted nucleic acid-binding protein
MRILLDTNIVLRSAQSNSPNWNEIHSALRQFIDSGWELCLVPQVLYEFWVAATRPISQNGFGLDSVAATERVEEFLGEFTLLRDERGIFDHWFTLVRDYSVTGKHAHDSRLVAAMQRHSVSHLLTINTADFSRFTMITAVAPAEILSGVFQVGKSP